MRFPLSLYALEPSVRTFEDAIREDARQSGRLQTFDLAGRFDFDAKLFVLGVEAKPPTWATLLEEGFPDYTPESSAMPRVALVIQVEDQAVPTFFAATFGGGRFLLEPTSYRPGYGLKVALNSIYQGDRPDAPLPSNRLRVVQSTSVGKNTMRTIKQANKDAAFGDFEVDLAEDQLGRVVGVPFSKEWGGRISGADAVRVQVIERLDELGALCRRLANTHRATDFATRFKPIDDIRTVAESEVPALEAALLETLEQAPERVALSPPGMFDWDQAARFELSFGRGSFEEIEVSDLLAAFDTAGEKPTLERLHSERIECLDAAGDTVDKWSIFDTLDTELEVGGQTHLLVGGRFYTVARQYLEALHTYLDSILESQVILPASHFWLQDSAGRNKKIEETEGFYNARAARVRTFELLDKKTVRLEHGDPIEICDLFTPENQLIHVKRKFSSSSLSHLFGQGSVSGDLLVGNSDFRLLTRAKLSPALQNRFDQNRPDTSAFEVVYAIIGPWKGKPLRERLPFFSKIHLRKHTEALRALGYRVTYSAIDLEEQPGRAPEIH